MSLDALRKNIVDRWGHSDVIDLSLRILDFIENTPEEELRFLTFQSFCNALGLQTVTSELIAAVNILVSSPLAALDSHAMFIDDEENEFPLEDGELSEALLHGHLIHPDTGEVVDNYERYVVPYFVPSVAILSQLR